MTLRRIYTLLFLIPFLNGTAQEVTIPGSQTRHITSSIVKGQEYELQIALPGGYEKSDHKYPVVYLMDSQWDFPLVTAINGQQYYDGFIPELIIVGIMWGGSNPNPDSLRARDYTPTHENRLPQSGGAANFLSFMKSELFPLIETEYKADPTARILMGCSFGGLFTLFSLFEEPNLFKGYIAASPAIGFDNASIYQFEKEFSLKYPETATRLFMTAGDVERGVSGFTRFSNQLKGRNLSHLKIESRILENTGHSGTKSETYSRGLQFIFGRNDLTLSSAQLKKYTGSYTLADGTSIMLQEKNNHLELSIGKAYQQILKADSEIHFYSSSEFLKLTFTYSQGTIQGFQLNRYNNSQFATKN